MNDIDTALSWLANDRVPRRLALTEASVLAQVSGHSFARREASNRLGIAAAAAALIMGIAGGLMPGEPARAQESLSPIGGAAELAPSSLLTANW